MFDPRSRLAYLILIFAAVSGGALFYLAGLSIDPTLAAPPLWALLLIVAAWLARRIEYVRLATAMETIGLFYAQAIVFLFLLYALAVFSLPFGDDTLAAADHALGFDWPRLANYMVDHPAALDLARIAYRSFIWQGALILIALVVTDRSERAWRFVTAMGVGLLLTALLSPLLPADGAVIHYGFTQQLPDASGQSFGPILHAIKDRGARHLGVNMMSGIVSFPSFHATAALLFAWAAFPMKYLRWPLVLVNAAMAASALIIGGHYLVDILSGLVVGWVALLLLDRLGKGERNDASDCGLRV